MRLLILTALLGWAAAATLYRESLQLYNHFEESNISTKDVFFSQKKEYVIRTSCISNSIAKIYKPKRIGLPSIDDAFLLLKLFDSNKANAILVIPL